MLKKWKYVFDEGKGFGALLTDFSEVLDSLDYELLIAKLYADGYSLPELTLVHHYLSHRRDKEKRGKKVIALC